jgi:hypothetical protein
MLITRVFYSYVSEFPVKDPPSKFPTWALWREMLITRVFYKYHSECPVKEPPLQVPLSGTPIERDTPSPEHAFTHL